MSQPVYFTVTADYQAFVEDATTDSDYDPQSVPIGATVTFTPLVNTGDVVRAVNADPRPVGYVPAAVQAVIDSDDGRLKLRSSPDPDGSGTFAPVRLLGNSDLLELEGPLFYQVSFTNVTFASGRRGSIAGFTFEAPSSDTEINLISVGRAAGQTAVNINRIAPGGVRLNDDGDIVFTFAGADIPDPIPGSVFAGPTGSTGPSGTSGPAGTITISSVTTLEAGQPATITNTGTAQAAVLGFGLPRGATGAAGATGATGGVGPAGPTGAAATIDIGDVSTGAPGSSVIITNRGNPGAALLDIQIPAGATGATGGVGPAGPTGAAATIAIGTVTTVSPGSVASVTNVGTSGAAVLNISIPKGDTGSASDQTWSTLDGKPAVIAAGATKAEARAAIDAEHTGNRGQALGYASLDAAGKVPYSQLPSSIMSYQGTWDASTNTPTLADGTGDQGDVYRVSVASSRNLGSGSISWGVGDYAIYNGTTWEKSDSTDAVASVNGYTGTVSLTKSDVGLSAVDNTADADKPISTATATALSGKEPTVAAGATGQYYRGDKAWATLDKNAVGLNNVDNTSDLNKPISTATETALSGKEPTITAGSTGQYWTGNKSWATLDTAAVAENGSLYFTNARADGRISAAVGVSVQAYSANLTGFGSKSAPSGDVVGTTDSQTLSGKTISGSSNTITNIAVGSISATGTASSSTYLRGDGSWQTVAATGETFNPFLLMGA